MLQISEEAEIAIQRIRDGSDMPESTSLRIAPVEIPGGGVGIGFAFVDAPEDGDQMILAKPEFTVYVAPELAAPFENAVLKATSDQDGVVVELRTQADLHDHGSHGDSSLSDTLRARRSESHPRA